MLLQNTIDFEIQAPRKNKIILVSLSLNGNHKTREFTRSILLTKLIVFVAENHPVEEQKQVRERIFRGNCVVVNHE